MHRASSIVRILCALATFSCVLACDSGPDGADLLEAPGADPALDLESEPVVDPADLGGVAIERSAPRFSVRGRPHLGLDVAAIEELYALDAEVRATREASAGGGRLSRVRDDDLDTGWSCRSDDSRPCSIRAQLPEPAHVSAVRIEAWEGVMGDAGASRVGLRNVSVGIGGERVEVRLPPGSGESYIVFDSPVVSDLLELELLVERDSSPRSEVVLAEFEIYGTHGVPREGFDLDPTTSFVTHAAVSWTEPEDGEDAEQTGALLGFVDESGQRRRWIRGTALFGQRGDDYLLVERLLATDCERHRTEYVLVDQRTRMFYALGDLGGPGRSVHRHRQGRGFVVGSAEGSELVATGFTEVAGQLRLVRADPREASSSQLAVWQVESPPLVRGGSRTSDLPRECRPVTDVPVENSDSDDEFDWIECQLGNARAYLGTVACGTGWEVVVVDAHGDSIARAGSIDTMTRGLRLMPSSAGLLAEIQGSGEHPSHVLRVNDRGIDALGPGTTLAARPPDVCGCSDMFVNPHVAGAIAPGDYGETC